MTKLNEMIGKRRDLKHEIKLERTGQHKEFVELHKPLLRFIDVVAVICIIFNFTALVITEFMVEKQEYVVAEQENRTITYKEANPVASELHEYKPLTSDEKLLAIAMISAIVKQGFLWALLALLYMFLRISMRTYTDLYLLLFLVCFYFFLLGIDCFHDVALLIAKVLYGS